MATTSIWPVKNRLDRVVNYAVNPDKTNIEDGAKVVLEYVAKDAKTEKLLYVTGVNCTPSTAYHEMQLTKKSWNREEPGQALAFHGYQSFAPEETTPDMAHKIGTGFAKKMWGERFQVVVATHLDRGHLHNHFVLNSISFKDGGRYHDNKKSYYGQIRKISDELCREYGLSVIEEAGKGKHYAEWKAEKDGKPTIRSLIAADIDDAIKYSYTWQSFVAEMKKRGYIVDENPNRKYMTVRHKDAQRNIRLSEKSLGTAYTPESIKARLAAQRSGYDLPEIINDNPVSKPIRYRNTTLYKPKERKKLKGFTALYFHYCYFLKTIKTKPRRGCLPAGVKKEVTKLEKYNRQFWFLHRNRLETANDVFGYKEKLETEIATLIEERRPLHLERKGTKSENQISDTGKEIKEINLKLRDLRKQLRLCKSIIVTAPQVVETLVQEEKCRQEREVCKEQKPQKNRIHLLL